MNAVAPGSCARLRQRVLRDDEEFIYACADAMREEYEAIIDAGLILQLDDPCDRRELGPDQPRADRRGLPALHDAAHRGAQPRDPRAAGGPHPLPPLLGQLARPARHRHPDARHRRRHAGESTPAPTRSRPATCATSTSGSVWQDVELPEGKVILPGRRQPRDERRRAPGARRRPHRALRRGRRPRERRRLDRLRPRRARAPADRLGEARRAVGGRGASPAGSSWGSGVAA